MKALIIILNVVIFSETTMDEDSYDLKQYDDSKKLTELADELVFKIITNPTFQNQSEIVMGFLKAMNELFANTIRELDYDRDANVYLNKFIKSGGPKFLQIPLPLSRLKTVFQWNDTQIKNFNEQIELANGQWKKIISYTSAL